MINPIVLFFGTVSFLMSLAVHILIWRIRRPARQIFFLIVIFIILPLTIYFISFYLSFISIGYQQRFIASTFNVTCITLWHILLSTAYIMSYPAIQAGSISLKIILAVSASMPQGLTLKAISGLFSEDLVLSDWFNSLINDGFIYFKNDRWVVSRFGHLLTFFFFAYRHLLKLPLEK